jgi:pyrroline-5-carboxylate reductase
MSISNSLTLGFVGFGKMAKALWEGISASGLIPPNRVFFYAPSTETQREVSLKYGIVSVSLETLAQKSNVILFCMKPQIAQHVLENFPSLDSSKTQLIVSILAGTSLSLFEKYMGPTVPCARVMPNTPAQLGSGAFGVSFNQNVTLPYKKQLKALLSSSGVVVEVAENQMDIVTALCGSSPAFLYQLTQEAMAFAQSHHMDAEQAKTLFAQSLIGAGRMLLESGQTPQELIENVCSPNGTTAAGLSTYHKEQIGARIQHVLESTAQRAHELSKPQGENV